MSLQESLLDRSSKVLLVLVEERIDSASMLVVVIVVIEPICKQLGTVDRFLFS